MYQRRQQNNYNDDNYDRVYLSTVCVVVVTVNTLDGATHVMYNLTNRQIMKVKELGLRMAASSGCITLVSHVI